MLLHHAPALNAKRIVLASGSPRRRELLTNIGLKFEVRTRKAVHPAQRFAQRALSLPLRLPLFPPLPYHPLSPQSH